MTRTFHPWQFHAQDNGQSIVLPDGCRDILVIQKQNAPDVLHLTEWDHQPRQIDIQAGTRMRGYRLRPGTEVSDELVKELRDTSDIPGLLAHLPQNTEWPEIIADLARADSDLPNIARQCGVGLRTLQRQFQRRSLPPPEFWRLLGRARRAALDLRSPTPLAHIAQDHGYADQAHFSRDMRRWFGFSPRALRNRPDLLLQMSEPALSTWTAEHSSIK
ncbi:MAG: AraC family transcriptional regulator [Pelagimonas sp.]